ncbi:alkaline phosphatase D family protein [Haloarchaeobius litoreus]|uniref:Alkaline phosphatase D family protein n=1 Tax=Haloarchaeobius litoreus TaxID=755306 RepID=A0ABD6DMP6_9EURY|nr:alkaline phosphatase D family protein [Haloarchaeobius litoreus]
MPRSTSPSDGRTASGKPAGMPHIDIRARDHCLGDLPDGTCEVTTDGDTDRVFPLSVASGGPTPDGVILWTRVAPSAYRAGTPLSLTVAEDPELERVVSHGRIPSTDFDGRHDHTVRIDLDGELEPDRHYHYRFVYDGVASRTGRCRTLPEPDDSPDSLRLAMVSCQHYQNGYFGAFDHLAAEDLDFVLHLGDYIYDSADDRYRSPVADEYPGRDVSLPSAKDIAASLEDFRELYRTYRRDRSLQAAHERHTFIRTWDDHAITNNRYWDYEADAQAAPDHPRGDDPAFMRQLTADGIQAWWEYTPSRVDYDPEADHLHDAFQLWRSVEFGELATLVLTDERLYRTHHPGHLRSRLAASEPDRTMLGESQREWFLDTVGDDDARWTVWANEVLSMPFRVGVGRLSIAAKPDTWAGYAHERDRVFAALGEVENAVTLTGDMHTSLAGYQRLPDGSRAGVELMTPSVTSVNLAEGLGIEGGLLGRVTRPLLSGLVKLMNPQFEFFDSHHWGYAVVEFTADACTYTAYSVDKEVSGQEADSEPLASYRVPAGRTELHRRPAGAG